ncbi:MAG TPA: ATP-dependent Clp protease adaptor ClpS [Saprospiraceae bacterium]|nr:ATP-dependent Clp protease adaptor ClpS [Saprospiraceae bacterium]
MNISNQTKEVEDILVDDIINSGEQAELVVLNDDYNTFEWVIECFMDLLKHTSEQAEQSAYIIHTKGRASVKLGVFEVLKPYREALVDRGLNAIIEHEKVNR